MKSALCSQLLHLIKVHLPEQLIMLLFRIYDKHSDVYVAKCLFNNFVVFFYVAELLQVKLN